MMVPSTWGVGKNLQPIECLQVMPYTKRLEMSQDEWKLYALVSNKLAAAIHLKEGYLQM